MNKKLSWIIGLQTVIIVTLFWVLVFYGKDEYEAYQQEQEEEIESMNRVTEKQGINIVTVPLAAQINTGIKTEKLASTSFAGEIKSFGSVVSIDGLIDAKAQIANLQAEVTLARSAIGHNQTQFERLKSLNADDKNVSDKAVQDALAVVNADKAKVIAAETQLKTLQSNLALKWGDTLAKLASTDKLPSHLSNLLLRKNVLVQVSLPISTQTPGSGSTIKLTPLNENTTPITATYVSPSTQSDTSGIGKTYYYSAPAELLRVGMRVNIETENTGNGKTSGVVIPNSAVVWYAGTPWVYFKQGQDQFIRKPISTDTEINAGWFNESITDKGEVVVTGAQLLLSEEFKYQIKNENED